MLLMSLVSYHINYIFFNEELELNKRVTCFCFALFHTFFKNVLLYPHFFSKFAFLLYIIYLKKQVKSIFIMQCKKIRF